MTIAELMKQIGEDKTYWEQTLIYVNGQPADDVSFGILPSTNEMVINIEHYD